MCRMKMRHNFLCCIPQAARRAKHSYNLLAVCMPTWSAMRVHQRRRRSVGWWVGWKLSPPAIHLDRVTSGGFRNLHRARGTLIAHTGGRKWHLLSPSTPPDGDLHSFFILLSLSLELWYTWEREIEWVGVGAHPSRSFQDFPLCGNIWGMLIALNPPL